MMLAVLLFALFSGASVFGRYGDNCSSYTWYTSTNDTTCRCGSELKGGIICSEMSHQVYLQTSFCMTWSNTTGTLTGICRYGPYNHCNSTYCRAYTLLPANPNLEYCYLFWQLSVLVCVFIDSTWTLDLPPCEVPCVHKEVGFSSIDYIST